MHSIGLIALAVICLAFVYLKLSGRIAKTSAVSESDIPAIVAALKNSGKDGNFAVLMFGSPAIPGDDINMQYSIEKGNLGFDWVLLAPGNIRDRDEIIRFADRHGIALAEREENDVRYLRSEEAGIVDLGRKILREYYKMPVEAPYALVTEGFDWKPQ